LYTSYVSRNVGADNLSFTLNPANGPNPGQRVKVPNSIPSEKAFIVKIQLPLSQSFDSMLVYNQDRSLLLNMDSSSDGYATIRATIQREGQLGVKGYFWAELDKNRKLKVFPNKLAPVQNW